MTPSEALNSAFDLLPDRMRSAQAIATLLAIQLQEAPNQEQNQIGGPAVGIWQFEKGGGIAGVFRHSASRPYALKVCEALGIEATRDAVYLALQDTNDTLDAAFARLLLWTDASALPALGDVTGAWQLYLRTWNPGAHSRGSARKKEALRRKWSINYAEALEIMVSK